MKTTTEQGKQIEFNINEEQTLEELEIELGEKNGDGTNIEILLGLTKEKRDEIIRKAAEIGMVNTYIRKDGFVCMGNKVGKASVEYLNTLTSKEEAFLFGIAMSDSLYSIKESIKNTQERKELAAALMNRFITSNENR